MSSSETISKDVFSIALKSLITRCIESRVLLLRINFKGGSHNFDE